MKAKSTSRASKRISSTQKSQRSAAKATATPQSKLERIRQSWVVLPLRRIAALRERRPHRSFVRTRRRDYARTLEIPGYITFTGQVLASLWRQKRTFFVLIFVFGILTIILGGLSSADTYTQMSEALSAEGVSLATIAQAGLLAASVATGGPVSEVQQLYLALMGVLIWLTTVWLLREYSAGNAPRFRDGLYNAGAPLMSTIIIVLFLLIQLLPAGILSVVYSALSQLDVINEGLGAFLFFGIAALVIALTLYWITSTLIALVVVTLPGMYPWQAIRAASDIVVGRRMRILLRFLWMALCVVLFWAIILIPAILLDQAIRSRVDWYAQLQLLPVLSVVISTITIVWVSSYVYLFYRKVVASDAA